MENEVQPANDPAPSPPDAPPPRKTPLFLPVILTVLPAIGSLLAGAPPLRQLAPLAFFASPLLSLGAGVILGQRTGATPGGKLGQTILWTIASLIGSVVLQTVGCSISNPRIVGG